MLFIIHRRNSIRELEATPVEFGVEIDLRSYGDRLIVNHEPFVDAIDFGEWLKHYRHKFLILNIKEEGIESRVKEMVEAQGIKDYFLLDLSFPSLIKMVNSGEKRLAVRFSEYESLETTMSLAGKVYWVWIDCFSRLPLSKPVYELLSKHFKLCLVSPELQGRDISEINSMKKLIQSFEIDAVCTKNAGLWK